MDHVPPPQQYGQQYDPQYGQQYDPPQYGFPSGPEESSRIHDDIVEPTQTGDFIPLALSREQRDVHPPPRYTHGMVSYLFYNLVNINYEKKINRLTDILSLFL
jgi:hypothetical protein